MRRLLRWSLWLALALLLALTALLAATIQRQPRTERQADITPAHVDRAVQLFLQHDPRRLPPGTPDTVRVDEPDLDLALNYLAGRFARTSSRVVVGEGTATLESSTRLPRTPFGRYLNVRLVLGQTEGLPRIERLRIGHLRVPARLANLLFKVGLRQVRKDQGQAARALDSLRGVALHRGAVDVAYVWPGSAPGATRFALWPAAEQARINAYTGLLMAQAATLSRTGRHTQVALATLLQPLMRAAADRSSDEASVTVENRAAIVALAQFVNAVEFGALFPGNPVPAHPLRVTLNGRPDTAQHFTVSAALAATAGTAMSNAVGLYKELSDARGGSGFSFNDLAADRAGTRFGEAATAHRVGGRKLQQQFAQGIPAAELLPPVADLPESMQMAEFNQRYGGVDGVEARRMRFEIEQRISKLPLYR